METDQEIRNDVEGQLKWDPRLNERNIALSVKRGVVMLAGYVPPYADKWHAEEAARRIAGVIGVANDIEVRLPNASQRPDPEIAQAADATIRHQLPFYWDKVAVIVSNGWVRLEGDVEWNYQRAAAEDAVRCLQGVQGLYNAIRIKPTVPPLEVGRKIQEAFLLSAEVDAKRITVEASGGAVTLTGSVRSWPERREAAHAAWLAPGVESVDNRIRVSP